ncbi:uncharacterized protein LOC115875340 [Sitophilus oryzae]|uniref:Uncharacterized protein LOC115875340 n=1 Tax=Sitophilus oryzae TaxID=7048 RepID=A0A6J2X6V9_SITOR|nr:uncharacterized protein LOC115875340 [Sitophilus oryzae]
MHFHSHLSRHLFHHNIVLARIHQVFPHPSGKSASKPSSSAEKYDKEHNIISIPGPSKMNIENEPGEINIIPLSRTSSSSTITAPETEIHKINYDITLSSANEAHQKDIQNELSQVITLSRTSSESTVTAPESEMHKINYDITLSSANEAHQK